MALWIVATVGTWHGFCLSVKNGCCFPFDAQRGLSGKAQTNSMAAIFCCVRADAKAFAVAVAVAAADVVHRHEGQRVDHQTPRANAALGIGN